jgi:hypothetical protein
MPYRSPAKVLETPWRTDRIWSITIISGLVGSLSLRYRFSDELFCFRAINRIVLKARPRRRGGRRRNMNARPTLIQIAHEHLGNDCLAAGTRKRLRALIMVAQAAIEELPGNRRKLRACQQQQTAMKSRHGWREIREELRTTELELTEKIRLAIRWSSPVRSAKPSVETMLARKPCGHGRPKRSATRRGSHCERKRPNATEMVMHLRS